ncbi:peptide chain release factor N(5)-glutamine methyltransferase, partial [Clavibacter lycopersici]
MADGEGVPDTVDALRMRVGQALAGAGIEDPAVDAELLIGHVLGLSRGQVQSRAITRAAVAAAYAERVLALAARR